MILKDLHKKELLHTPPKWVLDQTQYLVIMGSEAYGVSSNNSDIDLYGWCIPNKDVIFPHLAGEIQGFGTQQKRFDQWSQHHIKDKSARKEYDISVYNIVKYFQLVMQNNPNMIDSLFVPQRCILHSTAIANHVRENRKLFLHKGSWHTFKGYAYSQVHKMKAKVIDQYIAFCNMWGMNYDVTLDGGMQHLESQIKEKPEANVTEFKKLHKQAHQNGKLSNRVDLIAEHGYDSKFAYHTVRLLNEIEQILIEHDLDLERNRKQLKAVRNGDWSAQQIIDYFNEKEKTLEQLYIDSTLPHSPDEGKIKNLLLECLEMHFGNLNTVMAKKVNASPLILEELQKIIERYGN